MRRLVLVLLLLGLAGCGSSDPAESESTGQTDVASALNAGEAAGFARATEPRSFEFPAEHGPHPAYRNEWWYVTGNLRDDAGHRFGFQLTFFRIGLAPGRAERGSRWATHQVWMAHFAVTDAGAGQFHAFERFGRGGDMGLAGAARAPVRVWLEDWRLSRADDGHWRLSATADDIRLDLDLDPRKQPVLQGDHGLSRKSAAEGNASYYYSLTRIAARGDLQIRDRSMAVHGSAWMDREWSTSALGPGQRGWDWFALQLDDGTDVMLYRLREAGDRASRFSAATVVSPAGTVRHLDADAFSLQVQDHWTSPGGTRYPAEWRVRLDGLDQALRVRPIEADQTFTDPVRYWEGAVDIHAGGERIGQGYTELTGYAASPSAPAANSEND